MAVFLGCTSTGRVGLCFLWFFDQELSKAQPAVVLVIKRPRRRGNGLKSHLTGWGKPGIEPATGTAKNFLQLSETCKTAFLTPDNNILEFNYDWFPFTKVVIFFYQKMIFTPGKELRR